MFAQLRGKNPREDPPEKEDVIFVTVKTPNQLCYILVSASYVLPCLKQAVCYFLYQKDEVKQEHNNSLENQFSVAIRGYIHANEQIE